MSDEEFLLYIEYAIKVANRITPDDLARLRKLAQWADPPVPPQWDGRVDKGEVMRAVLRARTLLNEQRRPGEVPHQ